MFLGIDLGISFTFPSKQRVSLLRLKIKGAAEKFKIHQRIFSLL
jgi:hypothetical protein